jgi:SAM-dependent methyltransferase
MTTLYETLADVYEWLVPDPLLTPEGSAEAFAPELAELGPGARVLDCAAGIGTLAVGLALRGLAVTATDASPAMIARARALAARHDAALEADACPWEELVTRGWAERFDAVLCVGNSLPHARGRAARRTALAAMAGVLRADGLLLVTSRNWERLRAAGSRLDLDDALVRRERGDGLVVRAWTMPPSWEAEHNLEVAVALLGSDGRVAKVGERMPFWPFRHEELDDDLRAAGLAPESTTYTPDADRYLVTARRPGVDS